MYQQYFQNIALINLKKRTDRLEAATKILNDFEIDFELWEATDNPEYPCRGLVDSMQRYFKKVLAAGGDRCLLFEDDILPLVDKETFIETMNACVEQLPPDWDMFYPGCNVAGGLETFLSKNLLPIKMAYATHATAYSKRAMEFVVSRQINEPVDNCLVRDFQPGAKCFVSYPMLITQRPDYSDIGKAHTDWSKFLEIRYAAEIRKINGY
jgi:GR25 family glycosyltransferase involved in LPS biosynthesis